MKRRPPRSPLFPSPPLSRSAGRRDRLERDAHRTVADRVDRDRQTRRRRARDVGPELERIEGQNSAILGTLIWLLEDRKSTRLNSSHSQISYAVFCLKKKKHK